MKINSIIVLFLCVILMASCISSRPSYVLDSDDMEDLLYDIHRAHFIAEQNKKGPNNGAMQYALFLHVLKQHDVSQAEWDSSMVYYTRHADEMQEIYTSLMDRLDYEASAMGAGVSEAADSSDIWKADRHILLTADDINSTYQWKLDTDTLLKAGEKMRLRLTALFLNQNVERRATALIAMRLKNDSVIVRQQILTQTAIFNIEVSDDKQLGIKSLSGLFMIHPASNSMSSMSSGDNDSGSNVKTNQILFISDIKLLHEDAQREAREAARRDSINGINRNAPATQQPLNGPAASDQPLNGPATSGQQILKTAGPPPSLQSHP